MHRADWLERCPKSSQRRNHHAYDAHTEYPPDYVRQCLLVSSGKPEQIMWVARGSPREPDRWVWPLRRLSSLLLHSVCAGHDPDYEGTDDTAYLGCWLREVFNRIGIFDAERVYFAAVRLVMKETVG
jgi:hypothetical protein